ncbi:MULTISPECIES: hypothetical protein [Planktothricoides]|uniref:Uncharacterized protein n=2 Tax=Planktothricoides raciborskii TaxID=132608 RepID=A0AAU8JHK6_9CYAN|nr:MULTISPECIES: hypothetical protein [Planktothricoides]KOR37643.1 hypothetical protein AM228_05620 [Planktothricoides sp. SR001]MBD2544058.1 hypothetical protein [Planktothricoides raciborskii FACHB-1370]MBD2582543.1 hypothetical protein [Planktothricoides raciborskii FACHB-1261]
MQIPQCAKNISWQSSKGWASNPWAVSPGKKLGKSGGKILLQLTSSLLQQLLLALLWTREDGLRLLWEISKQPRHKSLVKS